MLREVISALDYSACAEIALAIFVLAFVGLVYGTLRLSRSSTDPVK
jgi:hypothetical protein